MERKNPLRICVDARLESGRLGGVEQVIVGLAHGLSRFSGDETYTFMVWNDSVDWLRPHISGPCSLMGIDRPILAGTKPAESQWRALAKRAPGARSLVRATRRTLRRPRNGTQPSPIALPVSDGRIEAAGFDLIHFPKQNAFLTEIPSIFHPHDLQHVHYPEFFSPPQIAAREREYRAFCDAAELVTVTSEWNKNDLMEHFGLAADKIAVIQLAPALSAYGSADGVGHELPDVTSKFSLPERFFYYPAQTWIHKNHMRLLEAIALLRRQSMMVGLVCSGAQNEHYAAIQQRAQDLGIENQVRFLGFVTKAEVLALYQKATAVVMPSLFEAAGGFGPVSEAFLSGKAVACSRITSLPQEVGKDALLFDPLDPADMAEALYRLWTDESLRQRLAEAGRRNVSRFSWDRTVRIFRAHYRRIGGRELSDDDTALIAAPPLF